MALSSFWFSVLSTQEQQTVAGVIHLSGIVPYCCLYLPLRNNRHLLELFIFQVQYLVGFCFVQSRTAVCCWHYSYFRYNTLLFSVLSTQDQQSVSGFIHLSCIEPYRFLYCTFRNKSMLLELFIFHVQNLTGFCIVHSGTRVCCWSYLSFRYRTLQVSVLYIQEQESVAGVFHLSGIVPYCYPYCQLRNKSLLIIFLVKYLSAFVYNSAHKDIEIVSKLG